MEIEVVEQNQLQAIVKESGLDSTKAKYILEKFHGYFTIAEDWEKRAKTLVVTDENQTAEMEMARTGRLFLKEKRIAIEKARKELKEQSLREGKAIDGIANVLKALIVPIEEYLENQEKFVEKRDEAKREAMRIEIEKRMAEEEASRVKAAAEEQERIRKENERLKAEAAERERKATEERKKQEAILAAERAKAEDERRAIEEKARKERETADQKAREAKTKADAERREVEEKARIEREKIEAQKRAVEEKARKAKAQATAKLEAERKEKERLEAMLKAQVECPRCHHKFIPKK